MNISAPTTAAPATVPIQSAQEHDDRFESIALIRIGMVALAVLASWLRPWEPSAEVVAIHPAPAVTPQALLVAAAIAERPSEHPLAKAVLAKAAAQAFSVPEPQTFDYTPGKGVVATDAGEEIHVGSRALPADHGIAVGQFGPGPASLSETFVTRGARVVGVIWIADVLRPEAAAAVRALRAMGVRTALVTGDAAAIARAIGLRRNDMPTGSRSARTV